MIPSKTVQLGVIVLALRLLKKWDLPAPRLVARAASLLGVSRKAGYEAAERLQKRLENETLAENEEKLGNLELENLRLKIRLQVLTYERDHTGVRFSERNKHLPEDAKRLAVRLLRDFREHLKPDEIASLIGVSPPSLRRWDKEADAECRFAQKEEERGKHRHHRAEDEERVLEAYKTLPESIGLEEFTTHYRELYPERPLDRKTLTRILQRHGLVGVKKKEKTKPYQGEFEVFYPGAQAAIDATELDVRFVGDGEEEVVKLKEEVAIDIASGAILGDALREEEDAEGVRRVVLRARKECEKLLAVLSDNGSANTSRTVKHLVEEETDVGAIFSFPYHPKTNGHLEGFFGQFSRIVGTVEIDQTSRETTARSLLAILWRIFSHFHNYSPRKRLGGLSPIEYLRRYAVLPEEVEAAERRLRERQRSSRDLRARHPRLESGEFRELVACLLREHRFDVTLERALRSLLPYDTAVIESARNAFFVASRREGFDERKRTFAYFMGIVRRKQKEIDEAALRAKLAREQTERDLERRRQHERELKKEREAELADLRENPGRVILDSARFLLSGGLRWMVKTHLGKIRAALDSLERHGRNTTRTIERLLLEIESWGEYGEDLKREMIRLIERESRRRSERGAER
jgi:transposase InsO family protein